VGAVPVAGGVYVGLSGMDRGKRHCF